MISSEIKVDYEFSNLERDSMRMLFEKNIESNPFDDYPAFKNETKTLQRTEDKRFSVIFDIGAYARDKDPFSKPYIHLRNCPTDREKPIFDPDFPLYSKYQRSSFIAESFLEFYSQSINQHPIAYQTMNNGDHFHDIYPTRKLAKSQSQKSLVSLGCHMDFPSQHVRPEFVAILSQRNPSQNDVYTVFARNRDIIEDLSTETISILEQPLFATPYDDISKGDSCGLLSDVDNEGRPIKIGTVLSYYAGRTTSNCERGSFAIRELNKAISANTIRLKLEPGDFIAFHNESCLHGREVQKIRDFEAHLTRWLVKTHTISSSCIGAFSEHFVRGRPWVVNG